MKHLTAIFLFVALTISALGSNLLDKVLTEKNSPRIADPPIPSALPQQKEPEISTLLRAKQPFAVGSSDDNDLPDSGLTLSCSLFRLNFASIERHLEYGASVSCVTFDNVDFNGIRVAVLDIVKGACNGFQCSYCISIACSDFCGFQVAAIANGSGGKMTGLQVGALNYCEILDGVQIGLINIAVGGSGVQIGALNMIADSSIPFFPILNARF